MRVDFETAQRRYAEYSLTQQDKSCPWGRNYDFYRLLDGIFNVKSMNAVLAEKNRPLGSSVKGDFFRFVVICSRHIEERNLYRGYGDQFLDCWAPFRSMIETMYKTGEGWSNELASSTVRLLFITAVVFNLPDDCRLENIVSNPDTRRVPGTFWAEVEDIEFSKALPCDLSGPFLTTSDVFINLKANLLFYMDKIERR